MQEGFAQWQSLLVLILTGINLVLFILNSIWARKVRRQDQRQKQIEELDARMTKILDKLDDEIVKLGREVSEIKGRIAR